jgi:hypothetical protein
VVILFIIAAIVMAGFVFFGMADTELMPWSCPSCYHGADNNIAGQFRHWYVAHSDGSVRCRWCNARFREHPNGSLVPDRN